MRALERRFARSRRAATGVLVAAMMHAVAAAAAAQGTAADSVFDVSSPGAPGRGSGGAFVASADDATSVYSNPAALTSRFRPEVSLEFRHWTIWTRTIDHGHAY